MAVDSLSTSYVADLVAGNLINWLLHGVLTVQIYLYYLAFPNDKAWLKAAVYIAYAFEMIHAIGLGITLLMTILQVDQYSPLVQSVLIFPIGSLAPLVAQCIYAHRVRIITQKKVMSIIIIVLAVLQLCAALFAALFTLFITFSAVFNVINDLIITSILIRSLIRERPLSDYTRLKTIRIIRLIIATGSLTVAVNLVSLTLIFTSSIDIVYAFLIFMPKLYANSVMVMLNNRMTIRNPTSDTKFTSVVSGAAIASQQTVPSVLGTTTSDGTITLPNSTA